MERARNIIPEVAKGLQAVFIPVPSPVCAKEFNLLVECPSSSGKNKHRIMAIDTNPGTEYTQIIKLKVLTIQLFN
ncbi:hypothetical protein L5D93_07975 [Paenibacillus thiaminolyticus]|nr:hypothetical protein [Paenibacillus thiaminolyticus]